MELLQEIRYWIIAGSCLLAAAASLYCLGAWLYTSPRWRALFSTLNCQFRAMPPFGRLVAIAFLAVFIAYGGGKTNNAPPPSPPPGDLVFDGGIQMQPEGGEFSGPRLTTNQYRAGFALVRVATNAAPSFAVPSNAVLHAPWTRYGVAEDTFWLPATNWAFILGTNAAEGLHVSSSGTLSFGWPKGSPRARGLPDGSELDFLAPLQTSIGIAPPGGRFWHAPTLSNSLLLTWQDVYANRDTNYPISFQSELFASGDFTFRYDLSRFPTAANCQLPTANWIIGAQHNGGGETYAFGDTNRLVNGLELRWRAFGLLDPDIDDHDGDGLSTYDEVMIHDSDPRLPDTDLDGLPDAIEVQLGTLLRERDTDGDGIPDGSDPDPLVSNAADADGDGLPDAWELYRFGSTNATDNAAADSDTDGFGNLAEMLIGSDPAFAVCAVSASEGAHTFTWTDLTGATGYTLAVACNGVQVWSCATNVCFLTLTDAFPAGDCTLAVASSGGVTSRTAQISFATPAAPNLTAWRIADPFALVPPAADGVILERTFNIARDGGWQQYFISSSPGGAGAWSLEHLRLDWSDSAGASGSATASPSGDSLRLPLSTNSPQVLTIRLVATGTNVLARSPKALHLLGWSPAVAPLAAGDAVLVAAPDGPVLAAVTDLGGGTTAASFTVDRGGRPCNTPPAPEELSLQSNPFAAGSGAEFTGSYGASGELTGGILLAGACGVFPLSGPGGGYAPEPGGGASQPRSPAAPAGKVVLFAPIATQLFDQRGGCPLDGGDGYPFDSACLREAWRNAAGGGETVSTGVAVSLGDAGLDALLTVAINEIERREYNWQAGDSSAHVVVTADGTGGEVSVWGCTVEREPDEYTGGCVYFWEAECGGCGDCADGDCGGTEGDSISPLRFRVPLGNTGHNQMAGFLWFSMETPQAISPANFQADVAPGVALTHGNSGGTLSRALCDAPGGRDITIDAIANGVRLSIKDANAYGEEFSWTITKTGEDITFLQQDSSIPANTLRHATYSHADGVWTCTDHLAGGSESVWRAVESEFRTEYEERTVMDAGKVLSRTGTTRTLIGEGEAAAWRETLRQEWDGLAGDWRYTTMSYWQDNLNPLVNGLPMFRQSTADGSWEYRQYDTRGRETLRAEPLGGSVVPYVFLEDAPSFAVSNNAVFAYPFDAVVTTTSYEPPPGDSADWRDTRRPRETRRYAVKDGAFTLTAREWNVFSRGTNDGWPTLVRTAVRAATAGAAFGDTANAATTFTSIVDDAGTNAVPVLMRGRPLREVLADGTLRTWSYQYDGLNGVLEITARTGTTAHTNGLVHVSTYTVERLDAVFGRLLERKTYLYTGGTGDPELEGESRQYDAKGRLIGTTFSDGTYTYNTWSCCRLESSQGRDGSYRESLAIPGEDHWSAVAETSLGSLPGADGRYPVAESFTDALGRETNSVRAVWHYTSRDPAYAPLQTRTEYPYGTDNYRVVTDPLGVQTITHASVGNNRTIITIVSEGITNRSTLIPGAAPVEERFWDGKWTRETRAASFGADGCRTETSVTESSDYPTVTNSVTRYDFLGRVACVHTPAFGGGWLAVSNFYDGASSRLLRVTRTGQPSTLYAYDELGNLAATALDVDGDGQIDYAGNDRISATATRHEPINGDWWRVTTQSIWHEAGVDACLTTGVSRVRLTGFGGWDDTYGGNLTARSETLDARGNVMRSSTYTDAAMPSSWQVLERPDSIHPALSYSVAGGPVLTVTATAVTNSFAYDGFARRTVVTDGRGNATLTHYNALGQEEYTENAAGNRTTYGYDALGRRISETDALTNTMHKAYDSLDNVVSAWGATYPVEQGYDTQGRKVLMKTFRDEEGAGDETRWLYDNATGLLTNKVYADGKGPAYTYTPDGNLATRAWARGVITSYDYDNAGSLTNIAYSDDTPGMVFQYDRMGRQVSGVTAGVSTNLYRYSLYGQITNETVTLCAAPLRETITRTYDSLGRESGLSLGSDYGVVYGFDDFGRFHSVSSTVASAKSEATYAYLAGSDLLAAMTNSWGFSWTRTFEANRELIAAVENRCGASPVSRFEYDNDPLARRTRRIDNLNVTNDFGYNLRSEVIGAAMGTNSYSYAYDPIGNRLAATNNQEGWVYQANPLNQYTNILEGAAPSAPLYDLDGNMTAAGDGWWYVWNGENRMVLASNAEHVVTYAYDHQGRMVAKTVDDVARQYLWDGYNILAGVGTVATNRFVWGLDLSGTLQGAGGVGGLLAEVKDGVPYFAAFDVNGNVTEHVATNGTIVAHYEYSPFGEIALQSGDLADSFTHRFSTKPWCDVTGLSEYEKRKYEPGMGRWLSRDPIGENGGRNLYRFCRNSPITFVDFLGLITSSEALEHYKSGPDAPNNPNLRTPLRMSFDEIDTSSVKPQQFPKMIEQLKACKPGTYQITWQSKADNLAFTTSGDQALFLGDVSLKLEGTLTVKSGGDWSFSGTLKCFDDYYDFNASTHRGPIGEWLTKIGREDITGKPYWIEIRGSKQAPDSGNCCDFKKSSSGGRGWY